MEILKVNLDGIPESLKKSGPRWCVWKRVWIEGKNGQPGKWDKPPYQSETRLASSKNPKTWLTYEQAITIYKAGKVSGIGLFAGGGLNDGFDDLTFMDWDHLEKEGISTDEVLALKSYAETSPSGDGAHCLCFLDKLPGEKKKKNNREIYKSGRYFTVTGHHIEGSPSDIRPADPEGLKVFYSRLCEEKKDADPSTQKKEEEISTQKDEVIPDRSEDEIIRIAGLNKKFKDLWKGQVSDDHSADDMALCNILAWASGKDPVMMDRVFRRSGLYREKWDENRGPLTYGQITIQRAISDCKEVYTQKLWISEQEGSKTTSEKNPTLTANPIEITADELKEHDDRVCVKDLKLNIDVPENHFINQYVKHHVEKTDAYPDYHYMAALTLLSIAADRTVIIPIKNVGGAVYTNLWSMCLGKSSFSRKSTALNSVKYIAGANGNFHSLPGMFSTEGLIEAFSDNPHGYLIKDECAQILGSINKKQYMSDVRDVLCELYDCGNIKRKLRTSKKNDRSEYEITDSYPVFLMATTPDNFCNSATKLDITSGWLIRFLYVYPRYPKPVKGLELGTEKDRVALDALGTRFNQISGSISAFDRVVCQPSSEALEQFNNWFIKKQEEFENSGEDLSLHSSILARILITSLKIAALLTLGDETCLDIFKAHGVDWNAHPRDIKQNHHLTPEIKIPDKYMQEAVRLVNDYFLPVASEVVEDLISRENENIQGRVIQVLKESPHQRLTRSELLRKMRMSSKLLDEHLDSLTEQELIEERITPINGKNTRLYLLKKGKGTNKSILEY